MPGVQVVVGKVENADMLPGVFRDANAAFWSTPNSRDRVALTEKFLDGCE